MPEHAALIALLIVDRALCLECIATRATITPTAAEGYLAVMRESMTVFHEDSDRCRGCGMVTKVFLLARMSL